jgi:hypothetical protein
MVSAQFDNILTLYSIQIAHSCICPGFLCHWSITARLWCFEELATLLTTLRSLICLYMAVMAQTLTRVCFMGLDTPIHFLQRFNADYCGFSYNWSAVLFRSQPTEAWTGIPLEVCMCGSYVMAFSASADRLLSAWLTWCLHSAVVTLALFVAISFMKQDGKCWICGSKDIWAAIFAPFLNMRIAQTTFNGEMLFWTIVSSKTCAERVMIISLLTSAPSIRCQVNDAANTNSGC